MKEEKESLLLKILYNTLPGRIVLKLLTSPVISRIGGAYMDSGISKIHIKRFIKNNNIDMSQYEKTEYSCFNDFFTRKILDEKRPVIEDDNILVSPCDARLSAYKINRDSCFSIKHSIYKISDLIENSTKSPDYSDGVCLVFRLCVDDYHRYRYIDDGNIVENRHIKGRLHTVRPIAVNKYPVFTQNSREYSIINTKNFGTIAQVEVGAMMIGKIKNHKRSGSSKRGVEKGMFLYGGSTIVILFQRDKIILPEEYFVTTQKGGETRVLCGQELGRKLNVSDHENDSHQR